MRRSTSSTRPRKPRAQLDAAGRTEPDAGVTLFENSAALRLERGRQALVKTTEGAVACGQVVLAGNVYLGEYGDHLAPKIASRSCQLALT
jgi:glycine/D-amino acid oxidase-like deaminating enzyme